jgi:predicted PurR-regulated permease PerM
MAAIAKLKLLASRKAADRPSAAAPSSAAAAADDDDLPIPSDLNTVLLGGLFLLAMLAACYVASEIVLPMVLAFVLSLVLQPAMRALERVRLPRGVAAMLLILVLFGTLGGLGAALSPPAASWAQKLPTGIPKLQERLSFLSQPIAAFQKFANQAQGLTQGDEPKAVPVAVQGSGLSDRLLSGTRSFASGLLETVLVLFFLLVSGDTFLRRLVEIMPRFRDKRQAVDISKQIESDVSAYLFTVTIMNLAVGVASGTVMALCGGATPCCGDRLPSCSTTFRS